MSKSVEEVRRAAFEEWAEGRWGGPVTRDDGEYFNPIWESEWQGFNAALDAVKIQLPSLAEGFADHVNEHAQTVFLDAIEQTGLGLRVL